MIRKRNLSPRSSALVFFLFMNTVAAELPRYQLQPVVSFLRGDIPDLSTGRAVDAQFFIASDLEFFPNGSGESLLALANGSIAWLDANYRVRGIVTVDSANSNLNIDFNDFGDNEGLLGLTFDPNFLQNRFFYVHLVPLARSGVEVWRLKWDPSDLTGIWESRTLVVQLPKPQRALSQAHLHNHNGGNPTFGPDGKLYILTGDGGIGTTLDDHQSQDLTSYWGKLLRWDPLIASPPEIAAFGFRNPFTSTWFGNNLFIGDVGQGYAVDWEEVNRFTLESYGNEPTNFGWPHLSGECVIGAPNLLTPYTDTTSPRSCISFVDPIHGYTHEETQFIEDDPEGIVPESSPFRGSIVVGPVYQGDLYYQDLADTLIYADLLQGWVRGLKLDSKGDAVSDRHIAHSNDWPTVISESPQGEVVVVSGYNVKISLHRLTLADPENSTPSGGGSLAEDPLAEFPRRLSETELYSDLAAGIPLGLAIPYEPLFPLWTDGAVKERFLVLPVGTLIDTSDPSNWVFPVGTIFVKDFAFAADDGGERRIETRLLRKSEDNWDVATYIWNDTQDDAILSDGLPHDLTLAATESSASSDDFRYTVPGKSQCLSCHAKEADFVIGFEAVQLNYEPVGEFVDLAALVDRGLVEGPGAVEYYPKFLGQTDEEFDARGYLHGNCSHCHSPSGGLPGNVNLDYSFTQGIIGQHTQRSGDIILAPGDAGSSALLKMLTAAPGYARMPPLGSNLVDPDGISVVARWIETTNPNDAKRATVAGTAWGDHDSPLCALVLANGQFSFTCDETPGNYEMDVPLDDHGEITLFVFADGFMPHRQDVSKGTNAYNTIRLEAARSEEQQMTLAVATSAGRSDRYWRVSGTVTSGGIPICALLLANGQHMFTCEETLGRYDLEVPLDQYGEITLFGFADGFQPYKTHFRPTAMQ